MSKRDHKRNSQDTARFDTSRLAVLMKTPLGETNVDLTDDVREPDIGGPLFSRTATLHDPLTTGLLAEVARRAETVDFDEQTIAEARKIEPTTAAKSFKAG